MNSAQKNPLYFARTLLFVGLLVASDQAVKLVVALTIPLHSTIPMTPWFNLVHTRNPGAAFSLLANAGGWQRYFLIVLALAVSGLLLYWLWRGVVSKVETTAYISLLGGALGNVADRVRIGAVVDFLDFHWRGWHWPAFNLADVFVVSGAALLLLTFFLHPSEPTLRTRGEIHR